MMKPMDESDEHLVQTFLRQGTEELFRILYRKHTPRLFLFSLRLSGGDHSKAEDLIQETWIRAVQNLSKFEWRSKFASWLSGIALNCYRETRYREQPVGEQQDFAGERRDIDAAIDLETCIRRLPPGSREIFVLHDIEGYTHEEIAKLLNIGNGTSKSQLFEARKKLRAWLSVSSEKEEVK